MGLENRIVYDLVDVVEGQCRVRQAMIRDKRFPNLALIPAAQTRDKESVTPEQMVALTRELAETHDFVLVDSPAGIEQGFRNAIAGAQDVLVVTTPEVSAVRDADRIIGLVEAAELPPPRLIVNRFRPEMVLRGDMMDIADVEEILAIELIGVVPEDQTIITSTNRGEAAVFSDHSPAGAAFKDVARRMQGEQVVFPRYEEPQPVGVMSRLMKALGFARV
jgi:septum site-determining protein MinD